MYKKYLDKSSIRTLTAYLDDLGRDAGTFASKDDQAKAEIILNIRTLVEKL